MDMKQSRDFMRHSNVPSPATRACAIASSQHQELGPTFATSSGGPGPSRPVPPRGQGGARDPASARGPPLPVAPSSPAPS
eukprot:745917-Hanusia_phi.AAC.3